MFTAAFLTDYIASQKNTDYSYFIIAAVLSKGKQPKTNTSFDKIDFNTLTFPTPDEQLSDPQLKIRYKGNHLFAELEDGFYDRKGMPQAIIIKSKMINVNDAVQLMLNLSTTYPIINVLGVPFGDTIEDDDVKMMLQFCD